MRRVGPASRLFDRGASVHPWAVVGGDRNEGEYWNAEGSVLIMSDVAHLRAALAGKTAFVTGHSGFIGSWLATVLDDRAPLDREAAHLKRWVANTKA